MSETKARTDLYETVRGLEPSATLAINERSNALLAQGRKVHKLGLGQSPFPVPDSVVDALKDNAHQKDYLPVRGLEGLREVVAAFHKAHTGVAYEAADVLIGPGSKELMFLIQLVYAGELLLPSPSWVSYSPQAKILGREVHWIQTRFEDGWMLRAEQLDTFCLNQPPRPRLLLLNSPSNPTGRSLEEEALRRLAEVARKHKVIVLSDEIYGELHHEGAYASIAKFYPEGTIISSGLSKWCGAGGWRLGTFTCAPELRYLLDAMAAVASETFTSTSAPIQYAAIRAFEGGPDIERYLNDERRVLASLGRHLTETLRGAGLRVPQPQGGFYLMADFGPLAQSLAARGIHTSAQLCERLLEETGVAILPGHFFGRPDEELSVRIAYVNFDGTKALEEAGKLAEGVQPDEAWLRAVCPETLEAMESIAQWAGLSAS